MIDTILFDMDGTIYNETDAKVKAELFAADYIHKKTGIELEKVYSTFREVKKKITKELKGLPQANDRKIWFKVLLEKLNVSLVTNIEMAELYWNVLYDSIVIFEDFKFVLPDLQKKYNLYILTDEIIDVAREKLRKLHIDKVFIDIISAEQVGYTKPAEELYQYATKKVGKLANQILIIGDNIAADIRGGILAGMHTAWLQRGKYHFQKVLEKETPEIIFSNYVQIEKRIDEINKLPREGWWKDCNKSR